MRGQATVLGAMVLIVERHGRCTVAARAAGVLLGWLKPNTYCTHNA